MPHTSRHLDDEQSPKVPPVPPANPKALLQLVTKESFHEHSRVASSVHSQGSSTPSSRMPTPKVPPPTPAGDMTPTEAEVPRIPSSVTLVDIPSPVLAALDDDKDMGLLTSFGNLSKLSKLADFERVDDESEEEWDSDTDAENGGNKQEEMDHTGDISRKEPKEAKAHDFSDTGTQPQPEAKLRNALSSCKS